MSILGSILGAVGGGIVSGLFGMGSSYASAKMEYAQTKEAQERQYKYNTLLNKQQYNYQTKLNKTANQYSKGLMDYENKLTTAQNQWNAVNLPTLNRQGYENAGINPMLAVGSQSPTQMIPATGVSGGSASGSSVGSAQGARVDLLKGITDAYRTFQLDKEKNVAEIENLKANTDNTNAKTITEGYNQKLIDAETQLRFIDKALRNKDLEWYDRVKLSETRSMMINALANETQANASAMDASTARMQYYLNRADVATRRFNANNDYYKNYGSIIFGKDMHYARNKHPFGFYSNPGVVATYGRRLITGN